MEKEKKFCEAWGQASVVIQYNPQELQNKKEVSADLFFFQKEKCVENYLPNIFYVLLKFPQCRHYFLLQNVQFSVTKSDGHILIV